mmetsp:Transcript_24618/g.41874  ORF Transcript_24618/g.41874 Transcript_24618/m.41874 type:complete len:87 (-) Transcript_24618:986-1246(-)
MDLVVQVADHIVAATVGIDLAEQVADHIAAATVGMDLAEQAADHIAAVAVDMDPVAQLAADHTVAGLVLAVLFVPAVKSLEEMEDY